MKATKNIFILFLIALLGGVVYFFSIGDGVDEKNVLEENYSDNNLLPSDISTSSENIIEELVNESDIPEKETNNEVDKTKISFNIKNKSYIDNLDGTITDPDTGLMWTKDFYGKTTYSDAKKYIQNYSNYNDWRIPSIKELFSLMDFSGVDPNPNSKSTSGLKPFIDTNYFNFKYGDISTGDRIMDSQWITSSIYTATVMRNEECFFGVNFADGRIKCYPIYNRMNNGYFLRLVRGNTYGVNDFVDKGDGTVLDKTTGLVWQKNDSGKGLNWYEAIDYCENLKVSKITDWRLPNIKELQYIVDYSKSPDLTKTAAIDSVFEVSSIKNEAGQSDYPFFWSQTDHLNHNGSDFATYIAFGRAMGKMMGAWLDVHGAGAQRSDPKSGNPNDYPDGFGPQGDARRIYNYVRCVSD